MTEIVKTGAGHGIAVDGRIVARIVPVAGAHDSFKPLEGGAWKWIRRTDIPTDRMRMEVVLLGDPDFTMIPAVSYNGNGWGDVPEYVGDRAEDGTPWSFASHRVTIPACTYSENAAVSIALMAEPNSNSACSLYKTDEGEKHVLIFPEEEQPKTLQRHFWGEAFQGTMAPTDCFEGILLAYPSDGGKHRYRGLLDFAWRYYGHPIAPPRKAEEIYRLSIAYTRFLFARERDGFAGFVSGSQWHPDTHAYKKKEHYYEIGWVGQSASMANAFLWDYLETGDRDNLEIALEVHDAWLKYTETNGDFISAKMGYLPSLTLPYETMTPDDVDRWTWGEDQYESVLNKVGKPQLRDEKGRLLIRHDACNLGTGAEGYFEAYDLLQKIGVDRPEYLKAAFDTCDFALKSQDEDGCFAKAWDGKGNELAKKGTIGCFLILPLVTAYRKSGDEKYLTAALRAFDFYYAELETSGFTTAGLWIPIASIRNPPPPSFGTPWLSTRSPGIGRTLPRPKRLPGISVPG